MFRQLNRYAQMYGSKKEKVTSLASYYDRVKMLVTLHAPIAAADAIHLYKP